jgi:hypothetical protein
MNGPRDDPDGDGILNLLAYALNINPLTGRADGDAGANPEGAFQADTQGRIFLQMIYRVNRYSAQINVMPEFSDTLSSWSVPAGMTVESLTDDPVTLDPRFRARIEVTDKDKGFLRLKVEQSTP